MKDDWVENFITYDAWNGGYIAWDETQANPIGGYYYYHEAKDAVLKHAKTLNKKHDNESCVTKDMPFTINVGPNEKMTLNKKEKLKMDFQVGDRVLDLAKGKGTVTKISDDEVFPVEVYFDNDDDECYTENGYCMKEDRIPSLYHEGTEVTIKPVEPKRYPWVNIYLGEDEVCGGAKWNTKEDAVQHIRENNGKYIDTIQLKPKGVEK